MDLTRIDLCWSAVAGLSMIGDPRRRFPTHGLLLAAPCRRAVPVPGPCPRGRIDPRPASPPPRVATQPGRRGRWPNVRRPCPAWSSVRGIARFCSNWKAAQTSARSGRPSSRPLHGCRLEQDTGHNFALRAATQMGQMAELDAAGPSCSGKPRNAATCTRRDLETFYMTIISWPGTSRPSPGRLESLQPPGRSPFNLRRSSRSIL
jgi:hypothetical protein